MKVLSIFLLVASLSYVLSTALGTISIDAYSGTDDSRLTQAITASQSTSFAYTPVIVLSARTYHFTQTQTAYGGLKIIGPASGVATAIINVGNGASSWMVAKDTLYDVFISNIVFNSTNGNTQWWHQPYATAGTLYAAVFDSLTFNGFKNVFGNSASAAAITQVNFIGKWIVRGGTDTQFYLGGSDNELWTNGGLDLQGSSTVAGAGRALISIDNLAKTNVGAIVVSTFNGWSGIYVTGSTTMGLSFNGARFAGKDPSTPGSTGTGSVVTIAGGKSIWRNIFVGYCMTKPTASDHAVINHLDGDALWATLTYDRASTVSQSVPLMYVTQTSESKVRIFSVMVGTRGGTWTTKPIVKKASTAVSIYGDTSFLIA